MQCLAACPVIDRRITAKLDEAVHYPACEFCVSVGIPVYLLAVMCMCWYSGACAGSSPVYMLVNLCKCL